MAKSMYDLRPLIWISPRNLLRNQIFFSYFSLYHFYFFNRQKKSLLLSLHFAENCKSPFTEKSSFTAQNRLSQQMMFLFLNICAMKIRKKLISFSTCEGGFTDYHFSIPSRVENLSYLYKKMSMLASSSGHERVGPHGLSCPPTLVVPGPKKQVHHHPLLGKLPKLLGLVFFTSLLRNGSRKLIPPIAFIL